MPRGTYHHLDPDGTLVGVEEFSCAPGPSGWRYVSSVFDAEHRPTGQVDLTCDADWRQLRVLVSAGGWTVRGGVAGGNVVWVRTPVGEMTGEEQSAPAVGFTHASPAFAIAMARLLKLDLLDKRRVHLVGVLGPAAAVLGVDEGWALVDVTEHETETVPLPVERYEVADLATGERRVVHLAADVLLDAPGIELADLDTPPSLGYVNSH